MKIRDLEMKRTEKHLSFKDFYKYFKKNNYNLSIQTAIRMYKIYVR